MKKNIIVTIIFIVILSICIYAGYSFGKKAEYKELMDPYKKIEEGYKEYIGNYRFINNTGSPEETLNKIKENNPNYDGSFSVSNQYLEITDNYKAKYTIINEQYKYDSKENKYEMIDGWKNETIYEGDFNNGQIIFKSSTVNGKTNEIREFYSFVQRDNDTFELYKNPNSKIVFVK